MKVTLTVTEGPDRGRRFEFEARDRFLVGRASAAHLCVARDRYFSRHHFMVEVNPPNVALVDLNSTNGTSVNSARRKVTEALLNDGDVIFGGETRLAVSIDEGPAPARGAERERVCCAECGKPAERERARSRAESVALICQACQGKLRDVPVMPEGYRPVRELGRGSMGAVYLCEDPGGARCAVKLVMPNAGLSEQARASFLEQARASTRLEHEHIVRVREVAEPRAGVFSVVMEYVPGASLAERLAREGRLPLGDALAVTAQLLEALEHAHGLGLVHRDIKPPNVLLAAAAAGELTVKLADFGLAETYAQTGASGFVQPGELGDSFAYQAPEQIINFRDVKPPADLYAVAAVAYRMLTGACPHEPRPGRDPLLAILEDDIVPIARRDASIPAAVAAVIDGALARDPAARPRSAAQMRAALSAARLETGSEAGGRAGL